MDLLALAVALLLGLTMCHARQKLVGKQGRRKR
jgi:hypothetical protein